MNRNLRRGLALAFALIVPALGAQAAIVISPPKPVDADTFQLVVSLDEVFSVDALQVELDFNPAGLTLTAVDIDPDSPYSPQHAPQKAPQKQFVRIDRMSFLFVNEQADLQPGPLLRLTFDRAASTPRPALVQAKVRFLWVELIRDPRTHEVVDFGDEFDVARSAVIDTAAVPEPGTFVLLAAGLGFLVLFQRRVSP